MGSAVALSQTSQVIDGAVLDRVLPFLNVKDGHAAAKAILAPKPHTYWVETRGDFYYIHGDIDAFFNGPQHPCIPIID